jgi:hypothetical protein
LARHAAAQAASELTKARSYANPELAAPPDRSVHPAADAVLQVHRAEESVYIFSTLGVEPWGRYASGIVELITAIMLLVPATAALGGVLAIGVAAGAIMSHLTVLGIDVKGDGGLLFGLAVTVLVCGLAVAAIERRNIPIIGALLRA